MSAPYVFSPGLWWIGFGMNLAGSDVRILQMYSQGVMALSVPKRCATLQASRTLARWIVADDRLDAASFTDRPCAGDRAGGVSADRRLCLSLITVFFSIFIF